MQGITVRMQDRSDAVQGGCMTGQKQDMSDVGQVRCRTGRMQVRTVAGIFISWWFLKARDVQPYLFA